MRRVALGVVSVVFLVTAARAADPRFGPNDIHTLFVVGKSDDRNEVQYGIHLDASCTPIGEAPVYAYWRQLERGPDVTEDLNMLDRTVYGVREQRVLVRSAQESKVLMTIKATPTRGIAIFVRKRDGKCVPEVIATINGSASLLERVFVHVAGFLSVDWIEIRGQLNGQPVVEHVKH